ncbi:MAG TPA: hypothetical protein DCY03_23040 [Planctomycetaceae bacterium]|uniref:Uncharacterized protein n=1 Tax=Gimesia algae TaxID=2527971 RepID=A0A517VIF9_9PLAN|nr:hypothetical protein Pan161_44590 [Gimesia algae]HAW30957.1 hypothetical protein [Planctomycetaceae bacterium]
MARILNRARLIIYRAIFYCGITALLLLVGYVLSIGPVYAFMFHHPDVVPIETKWQIISFYSPLYVPCGQDWVSSITVRYIGFCHSPTFYF